MDVRRATCTTQAPITALEELIFTSHGLQQWFCPQVEGELSEGASIECSWPALAAHTVLRVSDRSDCGLVLSDSEGMQFQSIEIIRDADAHTVSVSHQGLPDSDALHGTMAGWQAALARLAFRLELKDEVQDASYEGCTLACTGPRLLDAFESHCLEHSYPIAVDRAPYLKSYRVPDWPGVMQARVFRPDRGVSIAALEAWSWRSAMSDVFRETAAHLKALVGVHAGSA